jgi:ABC-2 type transport system ATP-binding protein
MGFVKDYMLRACLVAVDKLSLSIDNGEIFGLLGPNGAGKTTAVLMLSTVIKPTKRTATVGDYARAQKIVYVLG